MSSQGLSNVETGRTGEPGAQRLFKIARYLGVPVAVFFDEYYQSLVVPSFVLGEYPPITTYQECWIRDESREDRPIRCRLLMVIEDEIPGESSTDNLRRFLLSEGVTVSPEQCEELMLRLRFELDLVRQPGTSPD